MTLTWGVNYNVVSYENIKAVDGSCRSNPISEVPFYRQLKVFSLVMGAEAC